MQGRGTIHPQQQTQGMRLVMSFSHDNSTRGPKSFFGLEPETGLVGACLALTHAPCLAQVRRGRVCVYLQGLPLINAQCAIIHLSLASLLNFHFNSFVSSFHVPVKLKACKLHSFPISLQINSAGFLKFLFLTPKKTLIS